MKKKIFLLFLFSSIFCIKKILIDIPMNIQNEKKQTWHPKINRYYLDESYIEIPKKSQEKYETNLIQVKQPFLGFKKENIEKKKCTCRFVKDENINNENQNYQQIIQPQQQIIQPQQQLLTNNQIPFNNQQPQQIIVQQPQQFYAQQQPQPQPQQIYSNQMMFTNPQQPVYYQNNNNNNMLYPNQNNLGNNQNLPSNTEPNKIVINSYGIYPPSNIQPNVQNNAIPVLTNVIPQQVQGFLAAVNY